MAAKDVGRGESDHSEIAALKQRFESSFPLDDLLPVFQDVLTVNELAQLHPTPQLKVGAGISGQEGISGHYTNSSLSRLC